MLRVAWPCSPLRCLAAGSFREIVELIEISENANAFGRREFAQLLKRLLAALVQGFHPSLWHGQRNIWHRQSSVASSFITILRPSAALVAHPIRLMS